MNKYLTIILIIMLIAWFELALSFNNSEAISVSEDTRRLCFEYANRDHEKEISPARWEYLKTIGNPNDPEFFYQSCIGHITGEPAEKEYMK